LKTTSPIRPWIAVNIELSLTRAIGSIRIANFWRSEPKTSSAPPSEIETRELLTTATSVFAARFVHRSIVPSGPERCSVTTHRDSAFHHFAVSAARADEGFQ
jgi:hypothetical protein